MTKAIDGDEVEVMFTVTVKKTLKREWCEGYEGIDPSDPDWARKMASVDADMLMGHEMTFDEFFMDSEVNVTSEVL